MSPEMRFFRAVSSFAERTMSGLLPFVAAPALMVLVGCAVGPDFKKPAPPEVGDYTTASLSTTAATPGVVGGDAQRFLKGNDISGDWWTLFQSRAIDALVDLSLKNNSDLKAAEATLRQAHEGALAQRGAYFPSASVGFSASHQQQPATLAPVPSSNAFQYDLFTPQLSISYLPDVFGLTRRTVESAEAQAEAARYQMLAAYTTLVNNVVVTAVQEASLQAQIDATRRLIDSQTRSLQILAYQQARGYASGVDLAAQKSLLAAAEATLPPLMKQKAQFHDLLAVLTGQYPSQAPAGAVAGGTV